MASFSDLIGKTLKSIEVNGDRDRIEFETNAGERFLMYHSQDCCETVMIDDITGDVADLIGTPILAAEEAESDEPPEGYDRGYKPESETWTFYKLRTIKGSVDIRWFGESNGYYSESVDFVSMAA